MDANTKIHDLMDEMSTNNPFAYSPVPEVPRVSESMIHSKAPVLSQLAAVQKLLDQLDYNFLPSTFFNLQKNRPMSRIISTAKEILSESLPIRCLEATFVITYLTQHLPTVERIPCAFKSTCNGKHYRHIVMIVQHEKVFGVLGLSRKDDLKDKPFCFPSIAAVIDEFITSYRNNGHELVSFKLGLHMSRDSLSRRVPCWRFMTLSIPKGARSVSSDAKLSATLAQYQQLLPSMSEHYDNAPFPISSTFQAVASPNVVGDIDDADSSDTEENRFRVQCVLQGKSPFAPLQAQEAKKSMVAKLRNQVSGSAQPRGRELERQLDPKRNVSVPKRAVPAAPRVAHSVLPKRQQVNSALGAEDPRLDVAEGVFAR